ncbi:recombinase family protein, partial [Alistipes shahii]
MIIGYLRVSTGKQNLANQQDEIRRFALTYIIHSGFISGYQNRYG